MRTRPGWDHYFLGIAEAVAARSDCRRARVGAVIVDIDHRIVGTGYPGTRRWSPGCLDGACPRGRLTSEQCPPGTDYSNCISIHAEVNALMHGDRTRFADATIYVTREPCFWCYKVIQSSGIRQAIYYQNATLGPLAESTEPVSIVDMAQWKAAVHV